MISKDQVRHSADVLAIGLSAFQNTSKRSGFIEAWIFSGRGNDTKADDGVN